MKPLLFIAALLVSSSAAANIYKCKGPSGATVYREVPCDNTEAQVDHQISAPAPSASPSRKAAPAKGKGESSGSSAGAAAGKGLPGPSSDAEVEAKMCQGFKRRYEEAQRMSCIQAVQGGTGKVMCMPEANRAAFIANLKELVDQNCR